MNDKLFLLMNSNIMFRNHFKNYGVKSMIMILIQILYFIYCLTINANAYSNKCEEIKIIIYNVSHSLKGRKIQ